jgi:hypothetical protein
VRPPALLLILACSGCTGPARSPTEERIRYLRPAQGGFVTECEFTIRRGDDGWSIASVTGRGKATMTVNARYGPDERLTGADVTLVSGERRLSATAPLSEVPPGIIVTSAPDWTDTLLLCRRYDRVKGGLQSFTGLWIHPEQPTQRLTFTVEKAGSDGMEHEGTRIALDRLTLRLRGNSGYVAWADAAGRMIKLAPLPFKEKDGLVLEGFEVPAAGLRPPR